jgi:hypothetical protein
MRILQKLESHNPRRCPSSNFPSALAQSFIMSSAKVEEAQPVAVPSTVEEPTKADEAAPEATSEATSETKAADADVNVPSVFGNGEEKTTKKPRTYENGMLKTSAQERYTGKHNKLNSKYDASILPVTDDHKTIRNQVTIGLLTVTQ